MDFCKRNIPGKEKSKNSYGLPGKDGSFGLCSKCNGGASGKYYVGW